MNRPGGGPTVLVVGGSRGIGAETARLLGRAGMTVVLTYARHERRAQKLVDEVADAGGCAVPLQVDITSEQSLKGLADTLASSRLSFDYVILCASGGLEADREHDYAYRINEQGQNDLLDTIHPFIAKRGTVVYLTSHEAHFHPREGGHPAYDLIARSKKAGEHLLLRKFRSRPFDTLTLNIISADLVENSYTAKILRLTDSAIVDRRRAQVDRLPTSEDVAREVVALCEAPLATGSVKFVWDPGSPYI